MRSVSNRGPIGRPLGTSYSCTSCCPLGAGHIDQHFNNIVCAHMSPVFAAVPLPLLIALAAGRLGQLLCLGLQQFVERLFHAAPRQFLIGGAKAIPVLGIKKRPCCGRPGVLFFGAGANLSFCESFFVPGTICSGAALWGILGTAKQKERILV